MVINSVEEYQKVQSEWLAIEYLTSQDGGTVEMLNRQMELERMMEASPFGYNEEGELIKVDFKDED